MFSDGLPTKKVDPTLVHRRDTSYNLFLNDRIVLLVVTETRRPVEDMSTAYGRLSTDFLVKYHIHVILPDITRQVRPGLDIKIEHS